MTRKIILFSAALVFSCISHAQVYMGKTCQITFFSDGAIEDITAKNKTAKPILNASTRELSVKVTVKGFEFEKKLMEEQFNQKYMESDKFPYALFNGRIQDSINYKKDGTYKVTVSGKLAIHGVEKDRAIPGILTIKGGVITLESKFKVALKDYNIQVTPPVAQNLSEMVEVSIHSVLSEFK